ncbi:MAG: alpha/beta fold hydrolase [Thermoplasmatota archaeon]
MASPPEATPHFVSACAKVDDFEVTYLAAGPAAHLTAGPSAPTGANGNGPEVVVLLHGFGAWSEVVWSRAIPALSDRYTVIAPDLLGFGLSSKPGLAYYAGNDPLEPEVRFLAAFLDVLGHEKVTLVGHSFGGALAMKFAVTFPERVEKLVLVNPMGLGRGIHFVYRALATPVLGPAIARPDRVRLRRMWTWLVNDRKLVTDAIIDRNYELLSEPGAVDVIAAARYGMTLLGQKIVLGDALAQLPQPKLLVWGREDRIFPFRHARRVASRIRNGRLVVFEDCGHIPPFEKPEEFNAALREFLDESGPMPAAPMATRARS